MNKADLVILNAGEIVSGFNVTKDSALACKDGKIIALGSSKVIKSSFKASHTINAQGRVVTPGLIDAHTHLVFAGSREEEFEMRLKGKTYLEIAKQGGGINATVQKTRKANKGELAALARNRLSDMLKHGTTTAEVKSGYGLNFKDEIKCLEVVKELDCAQPIDLVPTFMGAHDTPPEFKGRRGNYVNLIVEKILPEIARRGLAKFCDVFCEDGVFDVAETRRILQTAKRLGLMPKIHADEFKSIGATELACQLGAISCDHLLAVTENGISALKKSNTVAVLLPATAFFLATKFAPARRLIDEGVTVALGSDFNPGSSPTYNMQLVMTIACTQMKMTPAEALAAATINSAKALTIDNHNGSLDAGKVADILIWALPTYKQIPYFCGVNKVATVIKDGKVVAGNIN